jgi:hypothetical protein
MISSMRQRVSAQRHPALALVAERPETRAVLDVAGGPVIA